MAFFKKRKTVADIVGSLHSTIQQLTDHVDTSQAKHEYHLAETVHHANEAAAAGRIAANLKALVS